MCSNNCCCVRDQNFILWPFLWTTCSGGCVLNGWIITQPSEPHRLITDWWARGVATGCELGTDRRVESFHGTLTRAAVFRSPSNPPNNRAPLQYSGLLLGSPWSRITGIFLIFFVLGLRDYYGRSLWEYVAVIWAFAHFGPSLLWGGGAW